MNPQDIIIEQVGLSLETFQMAAEYLGELIEQTSEVFTECLLNDGKITVCGMGTSGAAGASFVAQMQSRFERDRPGLPAITLSTDSILTSAIAHDSGHGDIYARQIHAICHEADILLVISATGNGTAIHKAIQAAHEQGMTVVALTGDNGGDAASLLSADDIELRVENERIGCIQLTHHLLLNCLVELTENAIFGSEL